MNIILEHVTRNEMNTCTSTLEYIDLSDDESSPCMECVLCAIIKNCRVCSLIQKYINNISSFNIQLDRYWLSTLLLQFCIIANIFINGASTAVSIQLYFIS